MKGGMLRSWLRLLVVQASWNYDRMIGVGVGFSSEPMLRDLPGGVDGPRYRAAAARGAQYFNAHPYLAGLAVGALARAEHEELPVDQLQRLRTALTGPLGSVGDKLVWAGSLPFASALGVLLGVKVGPLAGVITFLVAYNAVHILLRVWGLPAGWHSGIQVARRLGNRYVKLGLRLAGPCAALAAGLALPIAGAWLVRDLDSQGLLGVGLVALVGVLMARWIWPTVGANRFGLLLVGLAYLAGWL